ncbi:MAG: orotidine-5'-phosphate decarboxylase [Acidimicrobiales bacterium]|nr:orotidine-5'-phosphate decarboxylase [Acidimicrobiales bacterium]
MSTTATNGLPASLREKMALALDVDDLVHANRLARDLKPWFGVVKVGLELYTAAGPDAIGAMVDHGLDVFLDLKLHDIPTTVKKASRVAGALGVSYLTMHAHGGAAMLRAGAEGLAEGASNAGLAPPTALAITVLTSDDSAPDHIVPNRLRLAIEAGCGGIVCSAADLKSVGEMAPRIIRVTPGIRAAGAERHDQPKAVTPKQALDAGADLLVIGRAVTLADDPVAAARALFAEL